MRSHAINYVVVGAFVIAMLAGLIVAVALLTGTTGATDPYFAVYRNVEGIKFGTQILYEGYRIGQVEKVTPLPDRAGMQFQVDFEVEHGWRIPADSVAQIARSGLLAAVTINIREGAGEIALKPGDRVQSRQQDDLFSTVASVASDIKALTESDLKPLMSTVRETVKTFGDLLGGQGGALVGEVRALTHDLSTRLPAIVDDVEDLTAQLNATAVNIDTMFSDKNRRQVDGILLKANTVAERMAGFSEELTGTRERIDRLLETVDTMVVDNKLDVEAAIIDLRHVVDSVSRHVDAMNHNLEGAARNMYEFSRQIRKNPGLLLGGRAPDDNAATE